MKNNKLIINTTAACLFIAATAITIYSCKKPLQDVELITNLNFTAATIGVQFVDAKTGENIGFAPSTDVVTVAINGTDKAQVVDVSAGTNYKPTNGFLSLAVKEGVVPTTSNPVDFTITGSCPGYLTHTEAVSINDLGSTGAIIKMVKITDAPTGVSFLVDNTSLPVAQMNSATGTTTVIPLQTLAPAAGSVDMTTATMSIPVGEKFWSGPTNVPQNRIIDPVGTTFGHFSGTDDGALGSIANNLFTSIGGNVSHLNLGSLVNVQMKSNSGRIVTNLSVPITVTQGLAVDAENAMGNPIQAGDTISRWSQNETTGIWSYEGNAVVVAGTGANAGAWEVSYPVTHFSIHATGFMVTTCPGSVDVNINFASFIYVIQKKYGSNNSW